MQKRRYNNFKGHVAEVIAALFLIVKGYRILARRYKVKAGEIDLIAQKGKRLAFIEVKIRSSEDAALLALTSHQQKRIIGASKYWLSRNKYYKRFEVSYDYITFSPWNMPKHNAKHFRE